MHRGRHNRSKFISVAKIRSLNIFNKMAAAIPNNFSNWLAKKLQELYTDETVFGSYIQGILDGDDTLEEKKEALQEILCEIIIDNEGNIIEITCNEIFDTWLQFKSQEPVPLELSSEDMNTKLAKLLESQSLATTKQKQYTEEEKKIREAILSQYSQMTDDEEEDEAPVATGSTAGSGESKENGLEKNLNAQTVMQAEKVKREQARLDSQQKKEKDKQDRANQKQQKEDKKEKRKTQKGERRR